MSAYGQVKNHQAKSDMYAGSGGAGGAGGAGGEGAGGGGGTSIAIAYLGPDTPRVDILDKGELRIVPGHGGSGGNGGQSALGGYDAEDHRFAAPVR